MQSNINQNNQDNENETKGTKKAISIGIVLISILAKFATRNEPLYHILPNILLLTPFHRYCPKLWRDPFTFLPEYREHEPIPEIAAADYTYEELRKVTKGFRIPVVIRGIFSDTTAVKKWAKKGYLSNILGKHEIAVMKKGNPYEQDDRYMGSFKKAFDEILSNSKSTTTLFFPVLSRFQYNTTEIANTKRLQNDVENLIRKDLEVDRRIWEGFSTNKHNGFHAMQMVIGRGAPLGQNYTGLAWHSEPGTNWFAQVHGSKRWHFLAPKDSPLLLPTRESINSIATSDMYQMEDLHYRLPIRYVELQAGDLLYNPDWEWHHTRNSPGLSIGVPMREVNLFYSMRNNPLYMAVTARNHILGSA